MKLDAAVFKQTLVTDVVVSESGDLLVYHAGHEDKPATLKLYPAPTVDSNTASVSDRVKFFAILTEVPAQGDYFAVQFLREAGYTNPIDVKLKFSVQGAADVVGVANGTCFLAKRASAQAFTVTVEASTTDRVRTATLSVK